MFKKIFGKGKEIESMTGSLSELKRKNVTLLGTVEDLQRKVSRLEKDNADLKDVRNSLLSENEELKIQNAPLKTKKVTLSKALKLHIDAFEKAVKENKGANGFYASVLVQKTKGKPEHLEVRSIDEMRKVFAKAKNGELTILSL